MHFSLYQNSMVISSEDRVLIKVLRQEKGYRSKKLLAEFPNKAWTLTSLKRLVRKIDTLGSTDRKRGSRWKRIVWTAENVRVVEEMSMSQETDPGSHRILLCIKLLESSVFWRQWCTPSFVRTWNWNASERLANNITILKLNSLSI